RATIDQEKVRLNHQFRTVFWGEVINLVHPFALQKISIERGKIPSIGPPLTDCNCWINTAWGLSCYHQLYQIQQNPGFLRLSDINNHWYYDRNTDPQSICQQIQLLDPLPVVKRKGSKNKGKNEGKSSTRRDPSLFEYAEQSQLSLLQPEPLPLPRPVLPALQLVPNMISTTQLAI
ncbi:hypothetical protein GcC1_047037, partial [Golovinomyces cichoracearum]